MWHQEPRKDSETTKTWETFYLYFGAFIVMMQIMQEFSTYAFEPFEGRLHYLSSLKWTSCVHAHILQPYSHLYYGRKLKPLVSKQAAF